MEAKGFRVKMSGDGRRQRPLRLFRQEMHPGTVIELSEVVGPKGRMFDADPRRPREGWDGSDPMRPFPSLAAI